MAKSSASRIALRIVGVLVLIALVMGAFYFWRPLTVNTAFNKLRMRMAGIEENYADVNGTRVHYYAHGKGEPLVLVHGFSSDANLMVPLLVGMAPNFQVFAIDLLGYGDTDKPADGYSIAAQSKLVTDFIEAKKLGRTNLFGVSMGGWIAMHAAASRPELIDKLVIANSSGVKFDLAFDPAVFFPKEPGDIEKLRALMAPPAPIPLPGFVNRDLVRMFQGMQDTNVKMMQSMGTGADLMDERLGQITVPTLVYWGEPDKLVPLEVGQRLAAGIPGARLVTTPDCGHMAVLFCAGHFVPAATGFLKE